MASYYAGERSDGRFGKLRGEKDPALVQDALESTIASMSSGDVLDFGRGYVKHAAPLNITNKSGLYLQNGTVETTDSSKANIVVDNAPSGSGPANRMRFIGMNIIAARPAQSDNGPPGTDLLRLDGGTNHVVKDCVFDGGRGAGLKIVDGCTWFRTINTMCRYTKNAGLWIGDDCQYGMVLNPKSMGNGDDGFCIDGGHAPSPRPHDITVRNLWHDGVLSTNKNGTEFEGPIRSLSGLAAGGTRGFALLSCYNVNIEGYTITNAACAAFSVSTDIFADQDSNNIRITGYKNTAGTTVFPSVISGGTAWRNSSALTNDVVGHPAVLVSAGVAGATLTDIDINDLVIVGMHSSTSQWRRLEATVSGATITDLNFTNVQYPTGKTTAGNRTLNTHYFDTNVTAV